MSASHRAYFVLVGLFALWVGAWGFIAPTEVGRALPWTVPPLHARFIAAMYLAGFTAMLLSLFVRQPGSMRIALVLASVWTGALFVVSLLNLEAFDFAKPQVWFWFAAYAVYPLWGAWLLGRGRSSGRASAAGGRVDALLVVVAVACLVLAAALAFAPAVLAGLWPWKVTPLIAHVYCGPFAAWGFAALLLAREPRRESRRVVLVAMVVFTALTIVASLLHRPLFNFGSPAAWLWFGGFAAWLLIAGRSLLQRN